MDVADNKNNRTPPPLVVDLDGTLLRSDLLLETGLGFVRRRPLQAWRPLHWLGHGKAHLKARLADVADINVETLPYNEPLIERLKAERASGRELVLATASDERLAQRVADHLGLFDRVFASDGRHNLSAHNKRDRLVAEFGEGGFDYAGNALADVPIWRAAREAWVVNPEPGALQQAQRTATVTEVILTPGGGLKTWARALRLHQWAKNLLIFVPLLAAHRFTDIDLLVTGVLAFLFFGLCASSVYLFNDLFDLEDDRAHCTKRFRPLAAGTLTIRQAMLAIPVLLIAAFTGAWLLMPWPFTAVLGLYYGVTLLYSLYLKRQMTLDVIALASLYTLRVVAGVAAFDLEPTFWLLAFSMFLFLSLALVKRYAELHEARNRGLFGQTRGRGYQPADLPMISSLGAAAGYAAVLVLALYVHEMPKGVYSDPRALWFACPLLLLWVTRVWMLAHRGDMHADPVVFALSDRPSLIMAGLFGLVFWAATWL